MRTHFILSSLLVLLLCVLFQAANAVQIDALPMRGEDHQLLPQVTLPGEETDENATVPTVPEPPLLPTEVLDEVIALPLPVMPPPEPVIIDQRTGAQVSNFLINIDEEPSWFSASAENSTSVAWGDVDLDGDLDLAVGNQALNGETGIAIFLNRDGVLDRQASWTNDTITFVNDLTWGDMDADGDLDLAVARGDEFNDSQLSSIYILRNLQQENDEFNLDVAWQSMPGIANAVDWGDANGDAQLDLAVGSGTVDSEGGVRVYLNSNGVFSTTAAWENTWPGIYTDVAWGDMDGDGDLDLAAGAEGNNYVYENVRIDGDPFELKEAWFSEDLWSTSSVAWIDINEDGRLDLSAGNDIAEPFIQSSSDSTFDPALANTFDYGSNLVIYLNGPDGLEPWPSWESFQIARTTGIEWGDADADGDFDLLVANDFWPGGFGATEVYINEGPDTDGYPRLFPDWRSTPLDNSNDAAFADHDNDGDLDILVANFDYNLLYENRTGTLSPTSVPWNGEYHFSKAVATGDYDRDGDLDIAVSLAGQRGIVVYRHDGIDMDGQPIYVESWRDETVGSWAITWDLAWGDVDGDGDLDLAVASGHTEIPGDPGSADRVYSNDGSDADGNLIMSACWEAPHLDTSTSVAWADVDGDGDLDLAFGVYEGSSKLYLNNDGLLEGTEVEWQSDANTVGSIAWGDVDGDGDLDLAVGVYQGPNQLYRNDLGTLTTEPVWESIDTDSTEGVTWGDVDDDGDLDLVASNQSLPAKLYRNDNGQLTEDAAWQAADVGGTRGAVLGDVDGDGDLDLMLADPSSGIRVYQNRQGELENRASWRAAEPFKADAIASGDLNNDGYLDIVTVNQLEVGGNFEPGPISIHLGQRPAHLQFGDPAALALGLEHSPANYFALTDIQEEGVIPIRFSPMMPGGAPPRAVEAFYAPGTSSEVAQRWFPAESNAVLNLDATGDDGNENVFGWDVYSSGFSGRSDNVVLRLEAYPSYVPITNSVAGPYQRISASSETLPMRVRGLQPRVVDEENNPIDNAIVFRIREDDSAKAQPLRATDGIIYLTDEQGFLAGHASLVDGDSLIAMAPFSETHAYVLYHLSAPPTNMSGHKIGSGTVQTLTVSAENPLYLFNLDVSLEWDARNDAVFMVDLEDAFQDASDILYDITDGQVALGEVRFFHDKDRWLSADVVIHASNNQRPRASLGGVVIEPIDDPDGNLPSAYVPGQVRMGPIWDPYGESREELSDDWRNALAHELGHYLLFLPDNYLGVDLENGLIRKIDCPGSIMTDAYEIRYRELLTDDLWAASPPCADTLAEHLTGRSDWETVATFYEGIQIPESGSNNPGPAFLPLDVTQSYSIFPEELDYLLASTFSLTNTEAITNNHTVEGTLPPSFALLESDAEEIEENISNPFSARYIDLRRGERGPVTQFREAQAYLIKTEADIGEYKQDITDDRVIFLGTTGNGDDRIKVRGAERGDRLCIIQSDDDGAYGGCQIVNARMTSHDLLEYPSEWRPAITVSPVTSTTVAISVTVPVSVPLSVQLLPAYGPMTNTLSVRSPYTTMMSIALPASSGAQEYLHSATLTLPYPAFEGHVRIWQPNLARAREAFVSYYVSPEFLPDEDGSGQTRLGFSPNNRGFNPNNRGFNPNNRGFNPNNRGFNPNNRGFNVNRAWGANQRAYGAPVASGDGKVTIFNVENVMGDSGIASMSSVAAVPAVPSWQLVVGPAYRLVNRQNVDAANGRTIAFQYVQREVPDGAESTLSLYYSPDEGGTWMRLVTLLDESDNFAAARMPQNDQQGEGIYALMAALELPPLQRGWNLMAYPLTIDQPVTEALASIDDAFQIIYTQDPTSADGWRIYDRQLSGEEPVLRDLANDLDMMRFGHTYWIHLANKATPILPIRSSSPVRDVSLSASLVLTESQLLEDIGTVKSVDDTGLPTLPPSLFFGPIRTGATLTATETVRIRALIDGVLCGETIVQEERGQPVFRILVAAADADRACGRFGEPVIFVTDDDVEMGRGAWDNRRSQCLSLVVDENGDVHDSALHCADLIRE